MKTNNISIHNTLKNYYSLFIINCSLKTAFLLFIIHCSFFIKRKLFNVRSSLKTAFLLFIIHCSLFISNAQSLDQNYIKTKECLNNDCSQYKETITYFDGLGRPKQTLILKATPQGNDIATPIEYDGFGRQPKDYLPVPTAQNNGNYIPDLVPAVQSYYNTAAYDNTTNPYSEKELEASPLNRVLKQAAPGNSWKLGSGHEVKFDYQTNTATDAVRLFKAQTTWNSTQKKYDIALQQNGTYTNGQLYKTITKDENWTSGTLNTIEEYKDKEGHVVLKRTYVADDNGNTQQADTYYIYDLYGNLTYVLPPKLSANSSLLTINSSLNELGYQYIYDARNRLVEKKLPGKAWEYMVYDKQDRLVGTATYKGIAGEDFGNAIRWLFTKYDKFSRPVYTGIYNVSINRYDLQTQIDALASNNEQSNTTGFTQNGITCYYTQTAFPTQNFTLLSINYYDTYPAGSPTAPTTVESQAVQSGIALKTLPTATYTAMLPNTAGATVTLWEKTYTYYDTKSRPIRILTQNHLGGYTQTDSKLDFRGKPDYTFTYHKRTNTDTELKTKELFAYDAQERLLTHSHQINDGTIELLTQNQYDALGQLTNKKVGGQAAGAGLQKVDYTYNIRGWLKSINTLDNLSDIGSFGGSDLFAFKINYDTKQTTNTNVKELYNGNISETYWKTASDNIQRGYGYQYDALNRLLEGYYQKTGADNFMNERLRYDINGNITTLKRWGVYENQPTAYSALTPNYDDLAYTYDTGNKLLKVTDATNSSNGFNNGTSGTNTDYTYDTNGNMITDLNKAIASITYNHLNLPVTITFSGVTTKKIEYLYTANGSKVNKKVTNGSTIETTEYLKGFQYKNQILEFFPTAEGYVDAVRVGTNIVFTYVYNYTDHLGNVRLSYAYDINNASLKIMEENNYYPFGLKHNRYNFGKYAITDPINYCPTCPPVFVLSQDTNYKYKYQGQERQDELGLNWDSFKWRNYDYAIGRFMSVDPLSEKYVYNGVYNFSENRVIDARELEGLEAVTIQNITDNLLGAGTALLDNLTGINLREAPIVTNNVGNPNEYNDGQDVGDVASAVIGVAEVVTGASEGVVGVVAEPVTGGTSTVVAIDGVAKIAHGVLTFAKSVNSLVSQKDRMQQKNSSASNNDTEPQQKKGGGKNGSKINEKREQSWKQKEADARARLSEAKKNGASKTERAKIEKEIKHAITKQKQSENHANSSTRH